MDWFRSYIGTATDTKFRVVVKKSGARLGDVLAVWQMLLERACGADERGVVEGFDFEGAEALLDLEEGQAQAIYDAMEGKGLIRQGRVTNWDKRQPKRERDDDSTERVRAHRERKKQESNAICDNVTPCNATQHQETPRGEENREDKDKEEPSLRSGSCAELAEPPSAPMPAVLPKIAGTLPLADGSDFEVRQDLVDKLAPLYPAVEILPALRSMKSWLIGHPKKRKTRRGVMAFITGWLDREQNRGGNIQAARASPPQTNLTPRQMQTEMFKGMAQAIQRADGAENGENYGGRRVEGALPAGTALPRS